MTITLWKPEPNVITHQALGKLAEEATELAKICIRSMIQGLQEEDPNTQKLNRIALREEIADVKASMRWLLDVLDEPGKGESPREARKFDGFKAWQVMLEADSNARAGKAFDTADYFYRTIDPDDAGELPAEAIHRSGVGHLVVCEIASSFTGPQRFGFTAPVVEWDNDEEEFLHFATRAEAIAAATERRAALVELDALQRHKETASIVAEEDEPELCIACDVAFEDGDLVYWCSDDTGHLHEDCCGPEREAYVNADGEPLKDGDPIPKPFKWRKDPLAARKDDMKDADHA